MRHKQCFLAIALSAFGIIGQLAHAQADWTHKTPVHSPTKRLQAAMAQYGSNPGGVVVLFGGLNLGPVNVFNQHNVLGDTWIWNGSDWSQYTTTLATPPARFGASMAYDPVAGEAVLFGGQDANGNFLSDTWTFRFTSFCLNGVCRVLGPFWGQLSSIGPPARTAASMSYDPDTGSIVLTGGTGSAGALNDTWQFHSSNNTWTQLSTLSRVLPARATAPMAQCSQGIPSDNLVMLFGGGSLNTQLNDTWKLGPFIEGLGLPWVDPTPNTSPLNRTLAGMAYYPVSSQDVLYGGNFFAQEAGDVALSDTWNGNCISGVNWTALAPAHSPGPRFGHAMSTGPNGLTVVLFGGSTQGQTAQFPNGADANDTWTWGRRVACVPVDGSQIQVHSKVSCRYEPVKGSRFDGWHTSNFEPEFKHKVQYDFTADDPGVASITAEWTDASGFHSQIFSYTVVGEE